MVRSVLAVLLVGLLAATASAFGGYDFLYTNDSPMTADAGAFGIKASFIYGMANSYFDHEGESKDGLPYYADDENPEYTGMWIPISLYYGVTDQIEIGVQPKFINDKETWDAPAARGTEGECTASGIGDTWVYGKYMLMPEPMLTARVGVKIATGDEEGDADSDPTGDGQMDLDGAIMFGVPAGPGQFDGAVGYRHRMSRDETFDTDERETVTVTGTPGSEIHFDAHYTYFLNDAMNLRFGLNGFFGSDHEFTSDNDDIPGDDELDALSKDSAMNAVMLAPGFDYMMENGVGLGLDFFYPIMGQNIYADWGIGLSVMWGM